MRQRLRIRIHRKFRLAVRAFDGFLPAGGAAVDIGAHEGRFSLELARRPLARVVACEPFPRTARWALGGRPNCTVVEAAISDRDATAVLSVPCAPDGRAHTRLAFLGRTDTVAPHAPSSGLLACEVRLRTLDTLVSDEGLHRVDFVKIDVEGHEIGVLRGGARTIADFRPVLCVELSRGMARRSGATPEEVLTLLAEMGYRTARVDLRSGRVRHAGREDLLTALGCDRDTIDILATPAGKAGTRT